jgi:hypothetical protein
MVVVNDTTIRFDGCSIALVVSPEYRSLLSTDVRPAISDAVRPCRTTPDVTGSTRRLVLRKIEGSGGNAVALVTYVGGRSYTHDEEYKVRRISPQPDRSWTTVEMRVFGALHID